jgi:hypothetical protein
MLEYSEMPPVSRIYHEAFLISAASWAGENPSSSEGKPTVKPLQETKSQQQKKQELPSSEPKASPPGRERPKRVPTRFNNPDPILPGLQIKLSQDFRAKVIIHVSAGNQWTGPTTA